MARGIKHIGGSMRCSTVASDKTNGGASNDIASARGAEYNAGSCRRMMRYWSKAEIQVNTLREARIMSDCFISLKRVRVHGLQTRGTSTYTEARGDP